MGGLLVVLELISPQICAFLFPSITIFSLPSLVMSALLAELAQGRSSRPKTSLAFPCPLCLLVKTTRGNALSQTPALGMFAPVGRRFLPPPAPFLCCPCSLPQHRLPANGVELAQALSINGAEYKQNKAFISRAVISLLIYFTVHRLFICFHVFSAGVICGAE